MGLQVHAAPRIIQHQGSCSEGSLVTTSILAGCSQAVPFTKVYINKELKKVSEQAPGTKLGVYVDDVGMFSVGSSTR